MKVFILEDDDSLRMLLKLLLKKNFPNISQIGECITAEKALEEVPVFNPDLLLVDVSLPGMDGIEFIRALKKNHAVKRIIVLTCFEKELHEQLAKQAGADCFFSKIEYDLLLEEISDWLEAPVKVAPEWKRNGTHGHKLEKNSWRLKIKN